MWSQIAFDCNADGLGAMGVLLDVDARGTEHRGDLRQ
jgi:hypothetical protein